MEYLLEIRVTRLGAPLATPPIYLTPAVLSSAVPVYMASLAHLTPAALSTTLAHTALPAPLTPVTISSTIPIHTTPLKPAHLTPVALSSIAPSPTPDLPLDSSTPFTDRQASQQFLGPGLVGGTHLCRYIHC
jgi:hypothetical protein